MEVCDGLHAFSVAEMNTYDKEVCDKATGSGIGTDFITGVKMPSLNSTDKADPTQCSQVVQVVRRNISEGFDHKVVINGDEFNVTHGDSQCRSQAAHSQRQRGENSAITEEVGERKHLHKASAYFDQNNSRYIEIKELSESLQDDLNHNHEEVIKAIIGNLDTNKDKKVSYKEFDATLRSKANGHETIILFEAEKTIFSAQVLHMDRND
ncbi:hypothetical protein IEQ34_004119 [Dendrobium chrysotoxum]|uniref:EF-hand domain-containing protein n=1 Tax=Dendrobium chrysotoxum TaxID=161865 RepID=A0AAV7HE23_DENCH|nr:hypothetical protein IEQ34_004119 [Dendrobium chrysotoxum]